MIPQTVLDLTQEAIERGRRSCLICLQYQTQDSGAVLVCRLKPRTVTPTEAFTRQDANTAARRARGCKLYDPETFDWGLE